MALAALASCSDSEFVGDETLLREADENGSKAIVFGTGIHNVTRAAFTGADAAEMLNKNFVFMGTKTLPNTPPTTSNVFDHYTAKWTENTANTTLTNSNNWEYVGYDPAAGSSLPDGAKQTIKYWDYSASKYDFAAYSLGKGATIEGATRYATPSAFNFSNLEDGVTPVYTLTGSADALKACYISDLVTLSNNTQGNELGQVVNFNFRPLIAKVRLAFYETIPGYAVSSVLFYDPDINDYNEEAILLTANGQPTFPTGAGTMSISFPNNKAYVTFTKKSDDNNAVTNSLDFGKLTHFPTEYEGVLTPPGKYLGRTSNTATYADGPNPEGTYFSVLPNEDANNLMIRIKYTLVSTDTSGETIIVDNATAVIPKELAKWGPNYAYTYIFKISDMTNGTTGYDKNTNTPVMGLTPITLNAVVVDNEDGTQETITTVSNFSITTYMAGKVVTEYDDYITGKTIYVIVNDGKPNEGTSNGNVPLKTDDDVPKYRLFTATVDEGALQGITEASADNAYKFGEEKIVVNGTDEKKTHTLTDADGKKLVLTDVSTEITPTNKIAAADSPTGKDVIVGENMVATFQPAANTVYVFQYVDKEKTATYSLVEPLDVETLTAGQTYYTKSGEAYTGFTATGHERIDGRYYEITYIPAEGTTLTAGETYYTTENGGETYTGFTANGDESIADNNFFKKVESYEVIAVGTTLTAGDYYTESEGVYTAHNVPEGGIEVPEGATYYQKVISYVPLTAADGTTLTAGNIYYTTSDGGITYTQHPADGSEDTDGYFTMVGYALVTGINNLLAGKTYYTSDTGGGGFEATGHELVGGIYYEKVTENSVDYYYGVNRLKAGHIYYTSAKGAGRFKAEGTEIITANTYWICNPGSGSEGEYYYKVIKVQE